MKRISVKILTLLAAIAVFLPFCLSCVKTVTGPLSYGVNRKEREMNDSLFNLAWDLKDRDPDMAEKISREALRKAKHSGDLQGEADFLRCLGVIYKNSGRYTGAYDTLYLSLSIYEKIRKPEHTGYVKNNLGNLFEELEDYEEALSYYEHVFDPPFSNYSPKFTGEVYLNTGNIKVKLKQYREASELYMKSLAIFRELNDTLRIISVYLNMGEIFEKSGNPEEALIYYENSRKLAEIKKIPRHLMYCYYYLGNLYSTLKFNEKSLSFLSQAYVFADSVQSPQNLAEISSALGVVYARMDEYEKAYKFLSQKESIDRNLKPAETNKAIANARLNKQKELDRFKIQNRTRMVYVSVTGLVIALLLILLGYRNYRINQKANRLLREMDEMKSKFFSNITHELRTPLTLILGPLEEMLPAGEKKIPQKHEIKMMRRNARRLLDLVNQMLDLARLDAKSLRLELTESDFVGFFRIQISSFSSLAQQKGIHFTHSEPDEQLITCFDHDKTEKIISNLLSNAFKFTDPGGEVKCGLEIVDKSREMIRFFVSDTGKGISNDQIEKIFDRFYRIESEGRSGATGTGIGLSLTKEMVELLHGNITISSETGRGSVFTVTLPLGLKHLKKEEYSLVKAKVLSGKSVAGFAGMGDTGEEEEENPPAVIKHKESLSLVLVVEDEKEVRDYITGHLKESHRILEAENGKEGFEQAVKNIPDLVITDLIMPEMNGADLCEKMKTDERTSHIPVIILTARSGPKERIKGIERGADAYIIKPFLPQEVMLVTDKLIEQRKKLRERFSHEITLEPRDIAITSADENFLNRLLSVMEDHIGDPEFEVNSLENEMAMSRMQLFRKIKALTDQSPGEFIRTIRLKRAASLIEKGFGNIAQVSYEVGFNNPSYFAKCFRELYGCLPSGYAKKQG